MSTNKVVNNISPQNNYYAVEVSKNEWLEDTLIDHFGLLLKNCSEYQPRESWRIQCPDTIEPVDKDEKHIQILHSSNEIGTSKNGHWVCSFYNSKTIYIYDSLNLKRLHVHHKIYLEKLYPFYPFDKKSVRFPTVQLQPNSNDCGVFAIAFAVSLLFGLQPDKIMYNHNFMRPHLIQIFELNKIEHFPRIIRPNDPKQLFSLDEIQKRKALAKKKREHRQKKNEQDQYVNLKSDKCGTIMKKIENDDQIIKQNQIKSNSENCYNVKSKNTVVRNCLEDNENSILKHDNISITQINKEYTTTKKSVPGNVRSLSACEIHKLREGHWLNDSHIDYFCLLLKVYSQSEYQPRASVKIQNPDRIEPVAKDQKHIQILHSCSDMRKNSGGHWVCSYYDTKMIYIYDSLNSKQLHAQHVTFLKRLYPFYDFNTQRVHFPTVQNQLNGSDCGVFAIAFAVSLFLDIRPDTVTYDHSLMREHLAQMFESNTIKDFPQVTRFTDNDNNVTTIGDLGTDRYGIKRKLSPAKIESDKKRKSSYDSNQFTHTDVLNKDINHFNSTALNGDIKLDKNKYDMKRNASYLHSNENRNKKCEIYHDNILLQRKNINRFLPEKRKDNNNNLSLREKRKVYNKKYYELHKNDLLAKYQVYNKKYYELHKNDLLGKHQIYKKAHKNEIRCSNKTYYKLHRHKTLDQQKTRNDNLLKLVKKIKNKYNNIILVNNTVKMKYTKEKYIQNISQILDIPSITESRMEAERIVKWCFHTRTLYMSKLRKILQKCKQKAEVCLTRAAECSSLNFQDYMNAFCGQSKHTASSELYFSDSTYYTFNSSESIIINSEGKVMNILPIKESKNKTERTWECNSLCKREDIVIKDLKCCFEELSNCTIRNLHKFLCRMHNCYNKVNLNKLGHSHGCYINYKVCRSRFLTIEIVSPHFPMIRYIKRLLYDLINIDKKLTKLDKALNDTDIDTLRAISLKVQQEQKAFRTSSTEINLNEDEIRSYYHLAFKALMKRSIDIPKYACISCTKYCFERDIKMVKILKKDDSTVWSSFANTMGLELNEKYIVCTYCNRYFKQNKMPPICRSNKLEVLSVPEEITTLNDYEQILIQRAKAFQTVQRTNTVMNKNLPHKYLAPKVKGRTFHLPLPLKETLNKICLPTEPINMNHELYILVRGIPTKANIVWENLVNVKKIWDALTWLKHNNPIYSDIILPKSCKNLLHCGLQNVEFQEEDNRELEETSLEKENEENNKCDMYMQEHEALLTQMSQSDEYYEQFTIYPMYEERKNESATRLYQMLKIHDIPLDNRNKDLDVKCFPHLYPYGINGQHEERSVRITDFEYIRLRLMSQHSQFRLNIQYLFYLLHDNNMRQLNGGIFHKMNVTNPRERYTAGTYLEQLSNEQLESNLSTIFSRLRNTEQYWRIPRSNLHCMIRHYGPATWFLTFSPCEWLWTDLIEYLREVNKQFAAQKSASELIALDPVSASRFIDNKFKAMLDFICSPDHPIGEVIHYFWRREYQGRGVQHFHLLIWIKDAPIIGVSSDEDIASFILKYVTCRIPNKAISPELYRRVTTHQRHKHNDYCLRIKKRKVGLSKVCRFGFSRPVTDIIQIGNVAVSVANRRKLKTKSRLIRLPRSKEEVNINDYNPAILTAWEGNMDIQFVGEKSTLLTWYTTKYVSKAEKSTTDTFEKMNSTKSLRSYLWNIGMRMLIHRECGAFEAADTLLGILLYGTDNETTIRWLDINMIRNRRLKPRKEIEMLNAESTDIFYPSLIDTYYPNRPEELDSITLYDYAKWYDTVKTKPYSKKVEYYVIGESLYLRKRKRGYLINHYTYNVHTQPERYYFSLLLLFKPWRDLDELKNECSSYAEAFSSLQSQLVDALQYHERITDIQQGIDNMKELIEKHISENIKDEEDDFENCALECVPVETEGAMRDFKDVVNKLEDKNVDEMVAQLNADQKRIFDRITASIISDNDILRFYVSGEGGTGKSFLINTMRCWIKRYFGKDTAVTAPTGIAAFNIDGLTIHRLFQLPVEHGRTAKYKQLSDVVLKTVREELRNVVLIIIDEVSMISNITLMYIHLRLTEIFNTGDCDNGWFGKKHILLFGDLLQLPPVHEEPPFIELSKAQIQKYIGAMGSVNLWHLFSYDELQINVRQQGDTSYRDTLSRIRIGTVTDSDTTVLTTRNIQFTDTTCDGRLHELCNYLENLPADAVCLLPTCAMCDVLNSAMLNRISSDEIKLVAHDVSDCAPFFKKKVSKILNKDDEDSSRTAGLGRIIIVKVGARIMIRRNIDVILGLVNGTIGTITSIIRNPKNNEVEKLKIILSSGTEHTIERMSVKFEVMDRAFVIRKQFPICLSYGMTIHKSQGLSLKHAVVEAGNSVFTCGQIYVALSRVTALNGLHLINYDPSSVKANELAIKEYNRLREQYRPDLIHIKISKQRIRKVRDLTWTMSKCISDCQNNDTDIDHASWCTRGFLNKDNVSCYANASIQCIFHSPTLRDTLFRLEETNAMKQLLDSYISNNKFLSVTEVRKLAGKQYLRTIQQDAIEFIIHLIDNIQGIKSTIEYHVSTTSRCKICSYTNIETHNNSVLFLRLPENIKKSYTLQELIRFNFSCWNNVEKSCTNCGAVSTLEKNDVILTGCVLILQLLTFKTSNAKIMKINFNVKSVPTTKIYIGEKTYKVISAIFHHGENVTTGRYTNVVRTKSTQWTAIHDSKVQKCNWPRNAKNAYIFFAEQLK